MSMSNEYATCHATTRSAQCNAPGARVWLEERQVSEVYVQTERFRKVSGVAVEILLGLVVRVRKTQDEDKDSWIGPCCFVLSTCGTGRRKRVGCRLWAVRKMVEPAASHRGE